MPIDQKPSMAMSFGSTGSLPVDDFARPGAILSALFGGRLRQQFYSDVGHFGVSPEAPRLVALGYIALVLGPSWLLGATTLLLFCPTHIESTALTICSAVVSWVAFLSVRQRRNPQQCLDVMAILYFLSVVVMQSRHAGHVAPIVTTLPIAAGVLAFYQRPQAQPLSFVLAIVAGLYCMLSSVGVFGRTSDDLDYARSVMTFACLVGATLGLAGLAWMTTLSRDFHLHVLRVENDVATRNAARVRAALEAARVGLWDVPDTSIDRFNLSETFQSVTGYTAEEFNALFGNLEKFIHADDLSEVRMAFATGRKRHSHIETEFRLLTKASGYRWFSVRARYVSGVDGRVGLYGSLQDVHVIKLAEESLRASRDQAREANKAKSDFIGIMSHEVRTPLNAILGSVAVLKRGEHDAETDEMLNLIDDAGLGLLAVVNDLLDVSRIDAGKMEISLAPLDLTAAIKRTVEFWGAQAREKGLSVSVDCGRASGLPLLMLDAGRVRQIVGNLLSNAIKFTDRGSVSTIVSADMNANGDVDVSISVIDTGPGIPSAVAQTIFAAFEQGPGDASRGGAGLGLFISRRLARMMGGDLTLETAQNGGAHFRLTLNAALAEITTTEAPPEASLAATQSRSVLCVDDNERNRRIAELLLGKLGFEVTLSASGGETLDLCTMQAFDIILLDIVMPDMDGMETLRRLRSDPEGLNRSTPAIALTAKLSPEDLEAYRKSGFEGIAAKPINIAQLAEKLTRVFEEPARAGQA